MRVGATFRAAAVVSALLGVLLALGTWDGLYSRLDLPQAQPALAAQIGGVALFMLAYLIWSAAANPALRRPVGLAGTLLYLGSAAVIAAWLIFKDKAELAIGDRGWVILIVSAAVFALLGLAVARATRTG